MATEISDTVAILVNGRVNRVIRRAAGADRDLQQRLLGVGRHGHEEIEPPPASGSEPGGPDRGASPATMRRSGSICRTRCADRWSLMLRRRDRGVRAHLTRRVAAATAASDRKVGRSIGGLNEPFVAVAGTLDTKGEELRFIADIIKAAGLPVKLVDLSTTGRISGADVPPLGSRCTTRGFRRVLMPTAARWRRWRGVETWVKGNPAATASGCSA